MSPLLCLLAQAEGSPAPLLEGLRPLREPRDLTTPWGWWLGIGIGLLVGIGALILVLRHRSTEAAQPRAPEEPPHSRALRQLAELRAEQARLDDRAFAIQVSDILRHYLEAALQLPAPERTTEEFLGELQGSEALSDAQAPALSAFLEACDLAKFARQPLAGAERDTLLDTAHNVVEATRPETESAIPNRPASDVRG